VSALACDPGSFRDPGGRVYSDGARIFRTVNKPNAQAYEQARDSGLLARLAERDLLLGSEERDRKLAGAAAKGAVHLLEHPRIPFISYPYEWSASLLRKAALHHLDTQLEALQRGFTLSDATAYNVQFVGPKPVFIDHLSFRPYRDGEIWIGHRQFCMQFLNPLILWSRLGIAPNSWYRGSQEGIAPEDLAPLLRTRDRLSWTILTHVIAQAALQKRSVRSGTTAGQHRSAKLPKASFQGMLEGLRGFIAGTAPKREATVWGDYAGNNSYGDAEAQAKRAFVQDMAAAVEPGLMFDLGCNSGDYSIAALEAGAGYVVGFDFDFGALEIALSRAEQGGHNFLPLWLDAANPSPSQGWGQSERKGLKERSNANAVVALAFIHHIAIGKNVPLDMVIDWIIDMAPNGIIEFPPKSDPMVQCLLSQRDDIFPDYTEEAFRAAVERRARIVSEKHLTPGGRLLVRYQRA
jgi:ribosomal protein L11 methylase PrmA